MPAFAATPRFRRDYARLTAARRERVKMVVLAEFVPDADAGGFRPGLGVTGVRGAPGVFEMTWAPEGRATWQYGPEQRPGTPHVIGRRVGTQAIFGPGPP